MISLRERMASLEHEQWAHWTSYMLDNLTPENIKRWKQQIKTSYSDLSDKEKESDREWADKGIKCIRDNVLDTILEKANSYSETAEMPCRDGWHTGNHFEDVIRISYLEDEIELIRRDDR
jgi:hypothetical protein